MTVRARAIWQALTAIIGLDELLLIVALALITLALWPWVGRGALLPAGLVLLWVVLPSRATFVSRAPDGPVMKRRR